MVDDLKALEQRLDKIFSILDERISEIRDFIGNQFYGLLRQCIIDYAKEHGGFTENEIREKIAFRNDKGEVNRFDWYLLYSTFQYMKKTGQFNEVHRGKGYPVIYKIRSEKHE